MQKQQHQPHKQNPTNKPKPSLMQALQDQKTSQNPYPRGNRKQVMQQMTTISNQSLRNFNKCRKWKDVWDYHKKFTPWLDDTQIKEFLNLYKAQAQTAYHKGKLPEQKNWMLNDL